MREGTQTSKEQKKKTLFVEGVCEVSSEWQGTASYDGMVCTPPTELFDDEDTEDDEK